MIPPIHTLVVGVATVDEMDPVLPSAIRLAEGVGARLHVVHVFDLPEPILAAYGSVAGAPPGAASEYAANRTIAIEAALRAQCARFQSRPGSVTVRALLGSAHQALTEYAVHAGAGVLVVGATRRGRILRHLLGTTAERVLRSSRIPVLVLHQPFFRPVERVLLTTDLTALAAGVHEQGLDVVQQLFGPEPLDVRSLLVLPGILPATTAGDLGATELDEFLSQREFRPYPVSPRVRVGEPAAEINGEADAWGADLIVLGTQGRTGLARFAFGSVAAAALRDASRNVLVIPARELQPAGLGPERELDSVAAMQAIAY